MPVENKLYDPLSVFKQIGDDKSVSTAATYDSKSVPCTTSELCSICLEQVQERTQPTSCSHTFCGECIQGWTTFQTLCPLCKVPITELCKFEDPTDMHKVTCKFTVIPIVKKEDDDEDVDANFDETCYKCRLQYENSEVENRSLLVCDKCNFYVAHFRCLGFESVPDVDIICENCQ